MGKIQRIGRETVGRETVGRETVGREQRTGPQAEALRRVLLLDLAVGTVLLITTLCGL